MKCGVKMNPDYIHIKQLNNFILYSFSTVFNRGFFHHGGTNMKRNIGTSDRIFRIAAGLAIIIIGLVAKSWWGIIGIVPIITASVGHCPAYLPLGINTCKLDKKD